jgi:PAS domain S-box-containing protein
VRHRARAGDEEPVASPGSDFDHFVQLTDHSPDAICIHQDGQFVFFNAVAVRWLGARSARELLGHGVCRFVHARSIPLIFARTAALRRPGGVSTATLATVVRLDGSELHVEAVSVLTTWQGAVAYQLILRDLTDHRAMHDGLTHQAALVDHAGDEFVALCIGNLEPGALEGFVGRIRRVLSEPIEIPGGTI